MTARRDIEKLVAKLRRGNVDLTNLSGADLSRANLSGTNLAGTDLSGANLAGANLAGANLSGANLSGANLSRADLSRANLFGTNLEKADLEQADLEQADLFGANLKGADFLGARLREARLREARLREARLREARLEQADLEQADLEQANLAGANLFGVNLSRANLFGANLFGTKLGEARLNEANLYEADLRRTDLKGADLKGADFFGANLGEADLSGADLEGANLIGSNLVGAVLTAGAMRAELEGAHVNWRTIARSLRVLGLLKILVRTGMPEVVAIYLIDSVRSIDEVDLFTMLQSVFLSYGRPDAEFAEKLRDDLARNGVKTWFFPKDAVPGARLHRHLQTQIYAYDRLILCCSEASLQREGVLHEVEEVLEREQREGGTEVLIPVLLDPIFDTGRKPPPWWPSSKEHIYRSLSGRVAADFRGANDSDLWSEQLGRVLAALRKRPDRGESERSS